MRGAGRTSPRDEHHTHEVGRSSSLRHASMTHGGITCGVLMRLHMRIEPQGECDGTGADCGAWRPAGGCRDTAVAPRDGSDAMVMGSTEEAATLRKAGRDRVSVAHTMEAYTCTRQKEPIA
jgi:hypothetical protein